MKDVPITDRAGLAQFLFRSDWTLAASGVARVKLHKILTANRRISNIEPQNVEGWNRSAQSFFYKIDRSTQKLTAGRIPSFDI